MGTKSKLIIMGICIAAILTIFSINVYRRIKTDQGKKLDDVPGKENVITRAEAYRLLSYLSYDRRGREAIPIGIQYTDGKMSDWYDTYINAIWKMGLIDQKIAVNPAENLTYGECKALIDRLIINLPEVQGVYALLPFDFINETEEMLIPEFLQLYEAILQLMPEAQTIIEEKVLFVLGREEAEKGDGRLVTDLGYFHYIDAGTYEGFYDQAGQIILNPDTAQGYDITEEAFVNRYLDMGISVLLCGQDILYIREATTQRRVINNVWIKLGEGLVVDAFVNGLHRSFQAKAKLSNSIENVVGDITIENKQIIKISVKPDVIQGKVLLTGDDFIEIDGYGKVPLDEGYRIYKIYGELSMEPTSSILVGYETTDFVVSGGRISAALIKESIKAQSIRVLIKTTGFSDTHHNRVELTSNSNYILSTKDKETTYPAGEKIVIEPGSELLKEGRIKIKPTSEQGKLQLLSIERSSENPKYRGSIEIIEDGGGLLVVNELPLEEYLYAVIPSEMPTFYGLEPLKVQAVCARSYAYRHLLANSLREYGAHVDDSVSYQVYNNIPENEDSILAVKDTYGKVIIYGDNVITAYYFSTSCGHTTGVEHVWANGTATPYLSGRLMTIDDGENETVSSDRGIYEDLTKEDNFRSFILDKTLETYENEFDWYRWNVTIDAADIKKIIDGKLSSRYQANPELILTLVKGKAGAEDAVYESKPIETVGEIIEIKVLKRGTGGIISELLIIGSEATVKVVTEYNIRVLLSPINDTLVRNDLSEVNGLSLLPSAFFIIDRNKEDSTISFTLTGGGYGHGVGMSQNGVKSLSDSGMDYEDIVTYFYQGTELGFIYE